jgi:hypothetical protein
MCSVNRDHTNTQAMLAEAPAMEVLYLDAWNRVRAKSYDGRLVRYIEEVASLAQMEMSHGIELRRIIEGCLRMALPPEGLDYDECAIAMKALRSRLVWSHNKEFRKWWKSMRRRKTSRRWCDVR